MFKAFRLSRRKNEVRRARQRKVFVDHDPTCTVVSIKPTFQPNQSTSAQLSSPSTSLPATSLSSPHEPVGELLVSFPIVFFENCEVHSIVKLREWVKTLSVLPHGT